MAHPSLRVQRAAEDVCDSCVRVSILLQQPDLSELDRATLITEQQMHMDAAMSFFVHDYVAKIDTSQCLPATIIPDHGDVASEHDTAGGHALVVAPTVQVQIEDFGGSFSCPYYGAARPSADYYNSNLMMHNFVTTDISRTINKIVFYDQRGQGKDADAVCSLRMRFHLALAHKYGVMPSVLFQIMDNCVGQNKSKTVFQFFHNVADRAVAHCRNAMRRHNLYHPASIAAVCDEVMGIDAEFLDHNDVECPFFSGWGDVLKRHIEAMPTGVSYTARQAWQDDSDPHGPQYVASPCPPGSRVYHIPVQSAFDDDYWIQFETLTDPFH
ncbi:hypothetical protein ACHHYP_10594 [Achlya hypogyna]|uniref:Uncharacterized protein n=1 Tax=Achlya hypogyna TaxID=1202772 RepID=A0A1V9YKY5_ACHHY|nr:hypothetical protein ACHHYP_10594 [Achlya hypogyna]